MYEILFWLALIVIILMVSARVWPRPLSALIQRFPALTWIPLVGNAVQSEDSRRNLGEGDKRAAFEKQQAILKAAREARIDFSVSRSDQPRRKFVKPKTPNEGSPAANDSERYIKLALMNGFSSHTKPISVALPSNMRRNHLEQLDYFSQVFQSEETFRSPFNLNQINIVTNEPEKVDPEEIVAKLDAVSTSPTLVFLTGAIGLGKSTLAAVIIGKLRRRPAVVAGDLKRIVVPVDFESLLGSGIPYESEVTEAMMTDFVLSEIRKIVGPIKERTLSEHLARVKSRYIFIFDNLDLAYTEFCKRFVEGEDSVQGIIGGLRYLSCLKYLISVMQNSHRPGGINAPSALFCMRVDTMLLLSKAADRIGEPRLNERYQQYTLADFDTQIVCKNFLEIVSKRGNLACALLDRCEENGSKTQVSEFLAQLTQAEELRFRRYINLSVQGMRTSISSLCRYISQPGVPTGAVFNALCNNYKTEALGFFNGKEEYAQSRTNITNIFLVNAEYRRQSPSSIYPKGLKLEAYGHHHTYWLKYFILAFIAARSGEGIDPVSFDEVIDVFTDDCGYDRDLVALIIYSLTEIEHGRLVRPRSHDSSRLIALTSRGSEFVREGIAVAWSPAYLSTILEDEWLELPARIRDDLMLFGTDAFWDRESFGIYLENKFRAVVRFVICLEQALKYEGECRPRTISRLMAVDGFKSYLPRFSTVIQAVREEFQAQAAELNKDRQSELTSEMDVFLESKVIIQEIEALKGELQPLYRYRM